MGRPNNNIIFGSDVGNVGITYNNGTSVVTGYVANQLGTSSYLVTTDGKNYHEIYLAQTTAAATNLVPGQGTITLKDVNGNTSYVTKIQSVVCNTTDNKEVSWTLGPASADFYSMGTISPKPTSITRSPATVTLEIGATRQLTASVVPSSASQAVTYTSSSASATVSGAGLVTAVSAGSATITIKSVADATIMATVAVTVNAPVEPTPPEPEPTEPTDPV